MYFNRYTFVLINMIETVRKNFTCIQWYRTFDWRSCTRL